MANSGQTRTNNKGAQASVASGRKPSKERSSRIINGSIYYGRRSQATARSDSQQLTTRKLASQEEARSHRKKKKKKSQQACGRLRLLRSSAGEGSKLLGGEVKESIIVVW